MPPQKSKEFAIIGVNLCDYSSIRIITPILAPEMKTLLYYTDNAIMTPKCNSTLEINRNFSVRFLRHQLLCGSLS